MMIIIIIISSMLLAKCILRFMRGLLRLCDAGFVSVLRDATFVFFLRWSWMCLRLCNCIFFVKVESVYVIYVLNKYMLKIAEFTV